jgi:hypothetical protein
VLVGYGLCWLFRRISRPKRVLENTLETAPSATSRSLFGRAGDAAALRNAFTIAAQRRSFPATSMNRYRTPTPIRRSATTEPENPSTAMPLIMAPAPPTNSSGQVGADLTALTEDRLRCPPTPSLLGNNGPYLRTGTESLPAHQIAKTVASSQQFANAPSSKFAGSRIERRSTVRIGRSRFDQEGNRRRLRWWRSLVGDPHPHLRSPVLPWS